MSATVSTGTTEAQITWSLAPGIEPLLNNGGQVIGFRAAGVERGTVEQFGEATDEERVEVTERRWAGPLAILGHPTSDGRYLIPGEIGHRDLPIPFKVQDETAEGHDGALTAGRIDSIELIRVGDYEARDEFSLQDVPDDAVVVHGTGILDGSDAARLAERLIANGSDVSVDLPPERIALIDRDTLEEVDESTVDLADVLAGKYLTGIAGEIAAVTVVSIGAFKETRVTIEDGQALVASAHGLRVWGEITEADRVWALTAAAGPLKPPGEWFENPHLSGLTPLTITKEGRVYGHLADWDGCHMGFSNICVPPFRSHTDYAYFNVGEIECADGTLVAIGKLMFSMDGGKHADLDASLSAAEVSKHYDDATKIGAYVRAGTDRFGTWLAGVLRPDLSDEEVQFIRANPPSGDWRPVAGQPGSELVAAFSVPVPGFPIPRSMVASADDGSLVIISGPLSLERGPREQMRRKKMLRRRAWAALGR
jgi:hypothetical protein